MTSSQINSRNHRQQVLLTPQPSTSSISSSSTSTSTSSSSSRSSRLAEVVGSTAAECTAICCCCPCSVVNLVYMAVYKVPSGLCRRVMRKKKRQQLIKKGLLPPQRRQCTCGCDETEIQIHPAAMNGLNDMDKKEEEEEDESKSEVMKLEKEMWERFCSTGFWRSPSHMESIQR